jgi:hypothetical protein
VILSVRSATRKQHFVKFNAYAGYASAR